MAKVPTLGGVLHAIFSCFLEVAFFWQLVRFAQACRIAVSDVSQRLYHWLTQKSQRELLLETLADSQIFEEWEAAAFHLDEVLGNDLWRQDPTSKHYDYRLIYSRLQSIITASEDNDILTLVNLLRSGLVRNLGNITSPKLFNRAYAGTKLLIEDYITQVALAVEHVTNFPTSASYETGLSNQAKLDLLHDTRQAFGRSCLVMQGGSIFGLCHIGVTKALHLRGLLPRIVAGTATGALMAALVGVHTEEELLDFLRGDGIDLSAFAAASERAAAEQEKGGLPKHGWYTTLVRRVMRYLKYGYILDVDILEATVRANVGDLTFEEAYQRTKRVLNITISTTGGGVPSLLNYLTAPNVLIWSAAMASNASDAFYSPVTLKCKTADGEIIPWDAPAESMRPTRRKFSSPSTDHDRDTPLSRIAELFNVNHFIVSQARPYIAPFLAPSLSHTSSPRRVRTPMTTRFARLMLMEVQHRLTQIDSLGYLPSGIRRLLLDESVPGASLTLVPDISIADFTRLLRNPTEQEVNYWILRGERSVWPAVGALKVRCAVEVELDRGYQLVRRRKPFDLTPGRPATENGNGKLAGEKRKRKRQRAASMGAG